MAFARAPAALALISPVATIDGAGSEIVELGGVAMASDGTGGIVYRKRVDGRPHIFAALYSGGQWGPPQRVDVGESFESSFPAIAAGEGGRLVVVWTNHYSSTTDGLFSAALEPGSTGFQPPVPIDLDIGEAIGTYPSVAMNLAGSALVAYRVITAVSGPSTPEIPPGYVQGGNPHGALRRRVLVLVRAAAEPQPRPADARAHGRQLAARSRSTSPVRASSPGRSPTTRSSTASTRGASSEWCPATSSQVSPSTYAGHPLNGPADELAVDVGGFGEGAVAFRQQPAPGSGFTRPRVFVNEIPSSFDPHGAAFAGARIVDGGGAEGPGGPIGPLSMAVDGEGDFDVGFGSGVASLDARGTETTLTARPCAWTMAPATQPATRS